MFKRKRVASPISIILALLLLFDFVIYNPMPAEALDKKSVMVGVGVGAVAGAGAILAAPVIGGAIASAGGLAGIGAAIVGGIAAVGGAIAGVAVAIGGAIAAAASGLVGLIAGIFASPLFIPALIVIGVAVAGYLIYRHYKKKNAGKVDVIPETSVVTPGEYDMNPVIPPMVSPEGIWIDDDDGLVIPGSEITISGTTGPIAPTGDTSVVISDLPPVSVSETDFVEIEQRYKAAYSRYTKLVTSGGQGNVKEALEEYKTAYNAFIEAKKQLRK